MQIGIKLCGPVLHLILVFQALETSIDRFELERLDI